jgi:hypothetical protein
MAVMKMALEQLVQDLADALGHLRREPGQGAAPESHRLGQGCQFVPAINIVVDVIQFAVGVQGEIRQSLVQAPPMVRRDP